MIPKVKTIEIINNEKSFGTFLFFALNYLKQEYNVYLFVVYPIVFKTVCLLVKQVLVKQFKNAMALSCDEPEIKLKLNLNHVSNVYPPRRGALVELTNL